ncbi:hypothetical protein [Salinicoccus roseus]|uniref:hypothetical protein n=1 Tax=Salinicoccus roseus TaxID=45670 RepID=UPI0022FFCBCB|nr:hypothetical protein [Salinicoccus roseus]
MTAQVEKKSLKRNLDILVKEYEQQIIASVVSSFGLDALLVKDQHGGDVDTVHNIRKVDKDENLTIKNKENQQLIEKHSGYNKEKSYKYHQHRNYIEKNREGKINKENGRLIDSYTGQKVHKKDKIDLDHVISAHEIENDKGRIISGLNGSDLANKDTNLKHTDRSINRAKKVKTMGEFEETLLRNTEPRNIRIKELSSKPNLTIKEKKELNKLEKLASVETKRIAEIEKKTRKEYNRVINNSYYSSTKFLKDISKESGKKGIKMGLRQALGLLVANLVLEIRTEVIKHRKSEKFDFKEFFTSLQNILKNSYKKTVEKYKDLIFSFTNGLLSGIFSSIVTTLINIFKTTAKNVIKIMRELSTTTFQIINILVFNPENLPLGEVINTSAKILSIGASVVIGSLINEAISNIPFIKATPIINEVVPNFISMLVSGFISISTIYIIDNSKTMNGIITRANRIKLGLHHYSESYKYAHKELENYIADLFNINLHILHERNKQFKISLDKYYSTDYKNEKIAIIDDYILRHKINLPYANSIDELDTFMNDKSKELHFKL